MTAAKVITSDGAELHVEEDGAGEPLLLLHGATGTSRDWGHALDLAALARTYRVISPDARGHGRSTGAPGAFSIRRCAKDVLEIMDRLDVPRARAVGLSLGAKTLLHVATEAPERISAMVLVSATPRFPEATREVFRGWARAAHGEDEWAAMRAQHVHGDAQIAALFDLPARFAEDTADMAFTPERLAAVTARTLVVAGDRDRLYPVEVAVELLRGIPGASLYVVPGGGHGPIFGAERAEFERRTVGFLAAG